MATRSLNGVILEERELHIVDMHTRRRLFGRVRMNSHAEKLFLGVCLVRELRRAEVCSSGTTC